MSADPVFVPLRRLGEMIRAGAVSPVELAEAFLDRLETLGPRYNAVVTLTRERAMEQARRADAELAAGRDRGPLHGIPYGAKDLLATSGGIPTTWGAAPLAGPALRRGRHRHPEARGGGRRPRAPSSPWWSWRAAWAIASRTPRSRGPASIPWNRRRVERGLLERLGLGRGGGPRAVRHRLGDVGIDPRRPASYCGIAGLRPTLRARQPPRRHGAVLDASTSWGPIALTADDCGLVLDAIAGPDAADPTTTARPFRYAGEGGEPRRFRFAVLTNVTAGCDDDVRANFEGSLDVLRRIGTVEEVELPDRPRRSSRAPSCSSRRRAPSRT